MVSGGSRRGGSGSAGDGRGRQVLHGEEDVRQVYLRGACFKYFVGEQS